MANKAKFTASNTEMKTFYIVEIYTGELESVTEWRLGWKFEVYENKDDIPQQYIMQDETHCFWVVKANDKEEAVTRFKRNSKEGKFKGLAWEYWKWLNPKESKD